MITPACEHNRSVNIHVLWNDHFGGSAPDVSTLTIVVAPTRGSVTVVGENLLYEPVDGERGTDSMSYSICSLSGSCDQATVFVAILH